MKVKRCAGALACSLLLLAGSVGGAFGKDFVPEDYKTDEAIAKGAKKLLQQSGLKRIGKGDPKTVAITQFSVEYITSKKQLSGAGNSIKSGKFGLGHLVAKGVEAAGVGEKRYDLGEDFKKNLPNHLYALLVETLNSEGFNVLTLEQVRDSKAYNRFKTKDKAEGKTKKKRHGRRFGGGSTVTKVDRFSAEGLVKLKAGVVSGIKNARAEAQLMHDLDADITMRVNIRLGVYNDGKPSVEPGSIFQIVSGYTEGTMPGGKVIYNPKMSGQVSVKKQLLYGLEVVDSKNFEFGKGKIFKINSERFTEAMDAMFPAFARMAVSTFR